MKMIRRMATINKVISVVLNICLNRITDWATETLPLSLADDSTIAHITLPNMPTTTMLSNNHHLPAIPNPYAIMIDANCRLSYPLAKRLGGRANGTRFGKGNRGND